VSYRHRILNLSTLSLALILTTQSRIHVGDVATTLDSYIDSLQRKYSSVRDLRMGFIQTYRSPRRATKTETGTLFLRRPGMMRWEYKTPKEKLFVSNGKTVYLYLPEERQVQKSPVKESRDQRVPFLFLLGRGNLKKDFSKIEWALDNKAFFEGNKVIYAYPKKNIDEFSRILMEFNPQRLQLQRVAVYDLDGSTSEFVFTGIEENIGVQEMLFQFKVPPNVEVVGSDTPSAQTP
jgi:outer membrane lipoprotein carrier protein